jgi:hypothetical protein
MPRTLSNKPNRDENRWWTLESISLFILDFPWKRGSLGCVVFHPGASAPEEHISGAQAKVRESLKATAQYKRFLSKIED